MKRLYTRTNKNDAVKQIAKLERRQTLLRRAQEAIKTQAHIHPPHAHHAEEDPLPPTCIEMHHHISDSKNHPHDLLNFVNNLPHDPAIKVCT